MRVFSTKKNWKKAIYPKIFYSLKEGKMNFHKKWIVVLALLCLSACSINLLPSKDKWYAEHYIIMQDFEWKVYKELSPAGREQFQALFWKVRAPSAQETFMSRLDYVTKNFKKESSSRPWATDRGRIYLLNGNPVEIRYVDNTNLGGRSVVSTDTAAASGAGRNVDRSKEDIAARMSELWVYPFRGNVITYQFNFVRPKSMKLSTDMSDSQFRGELELYSRVAVYRILDVKKYLEQLEELKKIK